jgi:predicted alpha/beta-fold hydrolase
MRDSFRRKLERIPHPLPFTSTQLDNIRDFWQFDDVVTAPLHGFRDVHHYYDECSGMKYLAKITIPTLIIHAADDPFMDERVIPSKNMLPEQVEYELHAKGGHVGFIERRTGWRTGYYLERRIPRYLASKLGTS